MPAAVCSSLLSGAGPESEATGDGELEACLLLGLWGPWLSGLLGLLELAPIFTVLCGKGDD